MNFLKFEGSVAEGASAVELNGLTAPVPKLREGASGSLAFGVRPEHVQLSDSADYRGKVLAAEYLGTTQILTIEVSNGTLKARIPAEQAVQAGETVGLTFNGDTVTLFDRGTGKALRSALNEGVLADG